MSGHDDSTGMLGAKPGCVRSSPHTPQNTAKRCTAKGCIVGFRLHGRGALGRRRGRRIPRRGTLNRAVLSVPPTDAPGRLHPVRRAGLAGSNHPELAPATAQPTTPMSTDRAMQGKCRARALPPDRRGPFPPGDSWPARLESGPNLGVTVRCRLSPTTVWPPTMTVTTSAAEAAEIAWARASPERAPALPAVSQAGPSRGRRVYLRKLGRHPRPIESARLAVSAAAISGTGKWPRRPNTSLPSSSIARASPSSLIMWASLPTHIGDPARLSRRLGPTPSARSRKDVQHMLIEVPGHRGSRCPPRCLRGSSLLAGGLVSRAGTTKLSTGSAGRRHRARRARSDTRHGIVAVSASSRPRQFHGLWVRPGLSLGLSCHGRVESGIDIRPGSAEARRPLGYPFTSDAQRGDDGRARQVPKDL